MIDTIETNRLILRAPKLSDAKDFFEYAKKPTIGLSAGWLPHDSITLSKLILEDFIKKEDIWVITIKPNDKMVGTIGLHYRDITQALELTGEIGYALDDTYWNQGYITEAVQSVIKHSFEVYKFKKLICGHSPNNIGSQRVILKNNFKFTHIDQSRQFANTNIKEVYMYELINENWEE